MESHPDGKGSLDYSFLPEKPVKVSIYLRKIDPGYLFPVDPGTMIGWYVHFFGKYEPEVHEQIDRILKPGDVAFDVGANVGWHTLRMAYRVGATGKVFSFEPNDSTRDRLSKALTENQFSQVSVQKYALTDSEGIQCFDAPEAGDHWDGTGHLIKEASPNVKRVVSTTVNKFVLKNAVLKIDLMKIDVEGWELPVISGARDSFMTLRPKVIFEYEPAFVSRCGGSWEEMRDVFDECKYNLFALSPRKRPIRLREASVISTNFLAIPSEQCGNGDL